MARKGTTLHMPFWLSITYISLLIYNVCISNYVPLFFNKLSLTSWSTTQVSTMLSASDEDIRSASCRTRT